MKKYFKVLSVVMALILCMLVVVACGDKEEDKQQTQQLAAPTGLIINNDVASWSAVSNAGGYIIKVDASEHSVSSATTFDLGTLTLDDGTYQVSVKASGKTVGNTKYTDSAYSSSVEYTVKTVIADGVYAASSVTFNGQMIDFSNTSSQATRSLYEFMYYSVAIPLSIENLQSTYPAYDFYDLNTLKLLYGNQFDFTSITSAEQFWYAYAALVIPADVLEDFIQDTFNTAVDDDSVIIIEGDKITFTDSVDKIYHATTFTAINGTITLKEPYPSDTYDVFTYSVSLTYANGAITMTENLANNNAYVTVCELQS